MKTTNATAVFDYFRNLAGAKERPAPASVFEALAALMGATEVGVAAVDSRAADIALAGNGSSPDASSWRSDAAFMNQLRATWTALTRGGDGGQWIVSMVGEARLAWAFRPGKAAWTEDDKVQWMLAAQALVRWLYQDGADARTQSCLEQAAVVTSRLSHDFGNYLTGIMGFTELSLSQAPLDSTLHKYLEEVLMSAKQGADWIRRLQDFCRRGFASAWPTQLASVLAQEESRLRATGLLGMRWETRLPKDLPLMAVDAAALQTALAELIANARDASNDQGTLTFAARPVDLAAAECQTLLGTTCPGPHVELSISDDGPGISPDQRGRLFREPFFSTKPRHRGLGFLVVYGIMQRSHGAVSVDAGSDGKGTCVRLFLPVARVAGPALSVKPNTPHLLLVHTDPLLTGSMKEILQAHGCKVSVATNAHAAVFACRTKGADVDLVVTDLMMPQLAGLEMARKILEHDSKIKFIFLLAQASFHGLREEELLKRFDLLRWPVEPSALMRAVQTALART